MTNIIIPDNSVLISFSNSIGRLGNYLFNIASCTRVLHDLNEKDNSLNYFIYFCCRRNVYDGHGNDNAYNFSQNEADSYYSTLFNFDKLYDNDKISLITEYYEKLSINNPSNFTNLLFKQLEKAERLLWATDTIKYNVIFDFFPIIIEILEYEKEVMIYINNCIYEGTNKINVMYKNLYPINDNIIDAFSLKLQNVVFDYKKSKSHIFIKLNFVIISNYSAFHTDKFCKYFKNKLFNYKINNVNAQEHANNIYKSQKNKYGNLKTICLHFRGSDYGDPEKDADTFAVIGPQYYIDCIKQIQNKLKTEQILPVFFAAQEDLEFLENKMIPYLEKHLTIKIITCKKFLGNNDINAQLNIYFMGLFDYLCISNSTYSWWSAYLSSHFISNDHNIYTPLIYKYPTQNNYSSFNHKCIIPNGSSVILNNYMMNALVFYGYNSTFYIFLLLKIYIRQISIYINQIIIDKQIFNNMIDIIETICNKYKLIDILYIRQHTDKLREITDKIELQTVLNKLYIDLFILYPNKTYNVYLTDTKKRFNIIQIKEIFKSKDRSIVSYKDIELIENSILYVDTIDKKVLSCLVECS